MSKKNKKHQDHEEHADESWLLPYSDLMTLMLALFIVLYGMSTVDALKFQEMSEAFKSVLTGGTSVLDQNAMISNNKTSLSEIETPKSTQDGLMTKKNELKRQEQQNLEALKKQLDTYIKENGLTDDLETKLNQSQLMITISDKALFASGEAVVKPEARQLAKAISNMLQQFPDYEVIVSGHTDNVPISTYEFPSNWDLSSVRALNFMKILLLNTNLDPKKFSAIGYGEYHPVASNDTAAGRAQNRRVEVSIIRKYVDSTEQLGVTAAHE
ncbi:flagellar motor protein MotB [Paenibacillus phoenicis]|uniref:Flagellar motor protein MotB n=1 Tax=Paenibacillus phoenicis TaxID=554117 RepID=A0ABU5PPP6_9BACL|nr:MULTISPECIES: flagellar motor protein MotB [Paenibacillus]MCT2196042.1 flagellar motor protein MotB [Paenibacillus sp. p3-SID1389]MEA3571908.1 flagellar motor protein MotB [Paenibacillus phoenicis]